MAKRVTCLDNLLSVSVYFTGWAFDAKTNASIPLGLASNLCAVTFDEANCP
jgi:hypothetical protein